MSLPCGFLRWSSRLALLAALLLAVMPTISRIAGHSHAGGTGWVEVCTPGGLKFIKADAGGDLGGAPLHVSADGDCGYCPLAASLIQPALVLALLPHVPPPPLPSLAGVQAWRVGNAHPGTLGSRGPPILL